MARWVKVLVTKPDLCGRERALKLSSDSHISTVACGCPIHSYKYGTYLNSFLTRKVKSSLILKQKKENKEKKKKAKSNQACNPSTWEAKAGVLGIPGQLGYRVKSGLKNKRNKRVKSKTG